MSDHQRLAYSVLLPGFTGTQVPRWLGEAIDNGLAGVVLFAANTPDEDTTTALTGELHRRRTDLIVTLDEEGGDVSRLQADPGSDLPGNAVLGLADDTDLTWRTGHALGTWLSVQGIDLNLAPCLDINSNPVNPVIGVRSFGTDTDLVARHGAAMTSGLRAAGIATCGKHFPGHGSTDVDSHLSLPVADIDHATLHTRELVPFRAAIEAGLDAIMTGHLVVPTLGPAPATLNPAIAPLAREAGLTGPIITDALDMGAVARNPGFGEACVQALLAGADLLCLGTTSGRDDRALFATASEAICHAIATGRLTEDRLREAADRTQVLRHRIGELRRTHAPSTIDSARRALRAVGDEAARRVIDVASPNCMDFALPPGYAPVLMDLRQSADHAAGARARSADHALREAFGAVVVLRPVAGESPPAAARRLIYSAGTQPAVVLVRQPDLNHSEAEIARELLLRRPQTRVIHAGMPVPNGFPQFPAQVLHTFGIGGANARAATRALAGDRAEGESPRA